MQTFLPSSSFEESAKWLDDRRLNKQILEARTIYEIIINNKASGAWVNHPITKMWRDYPEALSLYYNACLSQWKHVRCRNHKYRMIPIYKSSVILPSWLGDERLHSSHRANLLRKITIFIVDMDGMKFDGILEISILVGRRIWLWERTNYKREINFLIS